MIPVLETERLIMRGFCLETDFDLWAEFYASYRSVFYGGPLNREQAWKAMAVFFGHWPLYGYGSWALEEKATGDFCGVAGLWNPEGWPEAEVGWGLIAAKEGKGYASEAGQRARAFAYETLGWKTLTSCIDPDNESSIRVAERLGARFDKEVQIADGRLLKIYRHPPPDLV